LNAVETCDLVLITVVPRCDDEEYILFPSELIQLTRPTIRLGGVLNCKARTQGKIHYVVFASTNDSHNLIENGVAVKVTRNRWCWKYSIGIDWAWCLGCSLARLHKPVLHCSGDCSAMV